MKYSLPKHEMFEGEKVDCWLMSLRLLFLLQPFLFSTVSYASYAAATPDEEGIGQHDYQSNNDSDHHKTPLNAKKSVHLDSP